MDRAELIVYTAPGCCLCDEAREQLDHLAPVLDATVRWVSIERDPELERCWRERIPAGTIDGRLVFKYRVDEAMLRRRIAERAAPADHAVDPATAPPLT